MTEIAGPEAQVGAIVLAAGGSARMGQPKQLLSVGGQPMVRRVVEAVCAAALAQVVVVVGAHAHRVQQALTGLPADIVLNKAWAEGLSTSIRTGLDALRPEIQAVLMVLADQPALSPHLVRALVTRYRATGSALVAPFYRGQRGNPVLFDRVLFSELMQVEGDQGGRTVIIHHQAEMECVEVNDPAVTLDIDTLQDYQEMRDSTHEQRDND